MWKKIGLIYNSENKWGWDYSHAAPPVVDVYDNFWRIYFSSRDIKNISRTSFIDVEVNNPQKIIFENKKPIIDLGKLGSFDELGISPTSIITKKNGEKILYYIGRSVKKTVSFDNFIGAAISTDGGDSFSKIKGPILGKDQEDPYFTASFYVFEENNNYKGVYMSGLGWKVYEKNPEPIYSLKTAFSLDGINWEKNKKFIIKLKKNEGGICQASVVFDKDKYRMWYCYRKKNKYRFDKKNSYRIGYAESFDLINWTRKDNEEYSLGVSDFGWDSEMVCYPCVIKFDNKFWMFYNGNGFGKTGIGCAVYG